MRTIFRWYLNSFLGKLADRIGMPAEVADRLLLLAGRQAAWQLRNQRNISTFEDIEFRVFSQWGEDGIVEWLLQNIPIKHKSFVEFGVESFREANTRFLLENRNWRGLVMDGSESNMQALRTKNLYWMYDLTAVTEFITRENINHIISSNGFAGDLGILSIDIDGNDYWVMEAINCVNPSIIICEYNPIFGDKYPVVVPYEPKFTRFDAHHSGLYFGAQLRQLNCLPKRKGMSLSGQIQMELMLFLCGRICSNI